MTDNNGQVIGVDLGTTFSAAAYLNRHGTPVTVPNAEGELTTPSVVLFDTDGTVVVGREAKRACLICPDRVAMCVKRDMGDKVYSRQIAGRNMPPSSIAALILRKLKQDVEQKIGPVSGAVITVPAYFDETRRQATVDAGTIAGLNVVDIINEPTGAALAYAFRTFAAQNGEAGAEAAATQSALVYDLGGGTFDVTIIQIEGNDIRVLATDGDVRLGGRDWDERIVNHAAELFLGEHNCDPREDPQSYQDLFMASEEAKKDLSRRESARFAVNHAGERMTVQLTRHEFEELTSDLLYRTESRVDRVVRQTKLTWPEIDEILLVGGSTRMPQVREMLQRITGQEPNASLSADEVVAHGAAIHAAILQINPTRAAESAEPPPPPTPLAEDEEDIVEMLPVTSAEAPEPHVDAPGLPPLPALAPLGAPTPIGATQDDAPPVLLESMDYAPTPPAPEQDEPVVLLDVDEPQDQAATPKQPVLQDLTAPPARTPLVMPPLTPLPDVPPLPVLKIIDETVPPQPPILEEIETAQEDIPAAPGAAPPLPELTPLPQSPPAPGAPPPLPELVPMPQSPPVAAPLAGGFDNDVIKALQEVYTVNVNAHSLGVIVCSPRTGQESVSVVIARNTPLPASKRKAYGTVVENQRQVKVRVTEGESNDPTACVTIGECLIAPLPPGLAQGAPISVTFSYDNSGRLHVRAKDETSGLTAKSTIVRPSTMSTQAVDQAQQIVSGITVS